MKWRQCRVDNGTNFDLNLSILSKVEHHATHIYDKYTVCCYPWPCWLKPICRE